MLAKKKRKTGTMMLKVTPARLVADHTTDAESHLARTATAAWFAELSKVHKEHCTSFFLNYFMRC
jgi:hypothetical protein